MVHVLNVQTGEDLNPPIKFLPASARAVGSMLAGDTLYAATSGNCGNAPNGVYALDLSTDAKTVASWDAKGASIAGTVAPTFGTDGSIFIATGAGGSEFANAIVSLDPATLTPKGTFSATTPFISAPVVFQQDGKDMVVAANGDGRLYLVDGATPGGADHKTALAKSPQFSGATGAAAAGLATWLDASGTRWVAVTAAGAPGADLKTTATNGAVTSGALVAFKITGTGATPAFEPGWVSRDMPGATTPLVMNGVVFAVAGGATPGSSENAAALAKSAKPAVLYALDADTGKELWASGASITSPVFGVGPSGGDGQVYVVAYDGTVYAFGMPMER